MDLPSVCIYLMMSFPAHTHTGTLSHVLNTQLGLERTAEERFRQELAAARAETEAIRRLLVDKSAELVGAEGEIRRVREALSAAESKQKDVEAEKNRLVQLMFPGKGVYRCLRSRCPSLGCDPYTHVLPCRRVYARLVAHSFHIVRISKTKVVSASFYMAARCCLLSSAVM